MKYNIVMTFKGKETLFDFSDSWKECLNKIKGRLNLHILRVCMRRHSKGFISDTTRNTPDEEPRFKIFSEDDPEYQSWLKQWIDHCDLYLSKKVSPLGMIPGFDYCELKKGLTEEK